MAQGILQPGLWRVFMEWPLGFVLIFLVWFSQYRRGDFSDLKSSSRVDPGWD